MQQQHYNLKNTIHGPSKKKTRSIHSKCSNPQIIPLNKTQKFLVKTWHLGQCRASRFWWSTPTTPGAHPTMPLPACFPVEQVSFAKWTTLTADPGCRQGTRFFNGRIQKLKQRSQNTINLYTRWFQKKSKKVFLTCRKSKILLIPWPEWMAFWKVFPY